MTFKTAAIDHSATSPECRADCGTDGGEGWGRKSDFLDDGVEGGRSETCPTRRESSSYAAKLRARQGWAEDANVDRYGKFLRLGFDSG
jgi:hypothetical protein